MPPAPSPVQDLLEEARAELERTQQELRALTRMVEQSRAEVDKLTQRSAAATAQVRQLGANMAAAKPADIKSTYDAVLDAQQRLFTMRGQLEKLQGEEKSMGRLVEFQQQLVAGLEGASGPTGQVDATGVIVRVVEAQDAERRRLSRQVHDGPAQALSNFILQTDIALRLFSIDAEKAKAELQSLKDSAKITLQKVRDFIFDLRPMMLDDLGVAPTLKKYVETFRERTGTQVTTTFTGTTDQRFEAAREAVGFRGVVELLNNIRAHAQATQVNVTFDMDRSRLRAIVEDNGKGFDAEAYFNKGKTSGLTTLKEQVTMLGGALEIDSRPGEGTQVRLELPLGDLA